MTAEQLLNEIADYCRRVGMAESTFGRRAVNDGKLVGRLRIGGRVTMETVERVRNFMKAYSEALYRVKTDRERTIDVLMKHTRKIGRAHV